MRILFTGASSFTGFWFVLALAKLGAEVHAVCQQAIDNYPPLKKERLQKLTSSCALYENCPFGSEPFLELIASESRWDLLCHHGALVENYKSADFDCGQAVFHNTYNISNVLGMLKERACAATVLTGTVFEPGEGGDPSGKAASSYGLSKGMTFEIFSHFSSLYGLQLKKFVIANPFGPYEERRFTTHLASSWLQGEVPTVNTPLYVRDNIPIQHLSSAYLHLIKGAQKVFRPSGAIESQGAFAQRFAHQMAPRLGVECPLNFKEQKEFLEPYVRVNTTPYIDPSLNEAALWDELAHYYFSRRGS